MSELIHGQLTEKIIGAAIEVHKLLGHGFLESVYLTATDHELRLRGLTVETQKRLAVSYKGLPAGQFVADMIVEGRVIVEVKAVQEHHPAFEAQVLNYLKATGLKVGSLLNFGRERLHCKRFVL